MSAIDTKLDHCRISLDDVRDAATVQDIPKFLARFTGYASHVSAVRQYLQNELHNLRSATVHPEQQWLQGVEDDINFAAVMGLRHVDQHEVTVTVERQHVDVQISDAVLTFDGGLTAIHRDASGQVKRAHNAPPDQPTAPPPRAPDTMTFRYFCEASTLPKFMTAQNAFKKGFGRIPGTRPVLKKGDDLPLKAVVIAYLKTTDLVTVAERAYAKLMSSIGYAKAQGFVP
jgi:hypothetical protein